MNRAWPNPRKTSANAEYTLKMSPREYNIATNCKESAKTWFVYVGLILIVFAFRCFCVLTMQVSLLHIASAKSPVAAAMLLKCCPNRDAPTRGCLTQSSPTVSAANGRIFCRVPD